MLAGAPFSICLARSPLEPKEVTTLPLPAAAKSLAISVIASLVLAAAKTTGSAAQAAVAPKRPTANSRAVVRFLDLASM